MRAQTSIALLSAVAAAFVVPTSEKSQRVTRRNAFEALALLDAAQPHAHAATVGAVLGVGSQLAMPHEAAPPPPLDLPAAAERYAKTRRRDGVDVPAACAFGALTAMTCAYTDLEPRVYWVLAGALVYDALRREFARLREIDRCTTELLRHARALRVAAATAEPGTLARISRAEAALAELKTRVAGGPLPRAKIDSRDVLS
mmetsp:Transcript_16389/g.48921  ORF Transcript_16389/g.48921 Transcript_16389/m.48921 type:complete len:201 (+) Transcript_16389:207-809(+)